MTFGAEMAIFFFFPILFFSGNTVGGIQGLVFVRQVL
jgi:hypothetical protein